MQLPEARVGPYLRALQSGLQSLAPNEDYVPLSAATSHLRALDPAVSGDVLAPAEVSPVTGMPAFPWMERAIAEQLSLGNGRGAPSADDVARASRLDPELGQRLAARLRLSQHLGGSALLPMTHLQVALKTGGARPLVQIQYGRIAPDGRWLRLRADVRGSGDRFGPFAVRGLRVDTDPGMLHFCTRHFATPLQVLAQQLEDVTEAEVVRLSRGWTGPFWFPGVQLPEGIPTALGAGLVLHISSEVMGQDVARSASADPLRPHIDAAPQGYGVFRERRFAASANLLPEVTAFCAANGTRCVVVPLGRHARARRL